MVYRNREEGGAGGGYSPSHFWEPNVIENGKYLSIFYLNPAPPQLSNTLRGTLYDKAVHIFSLFQWRKLKQLDLKYKNIGIKPLCDRYLH